LLSQCMNTIRVTYCRHSTCIWSQCNVVNQAFNMYMVTAQCCQPGIQHVYGHSAMLSAFNMVYGHSAMLSAFNMVYGHSAMLSAFNMVYGHSAMLSAFNMVYGHSAMLSTRHSTCIQSQCNVVNQASR